MLELDWFRSREEVLPVELALEGGKYGLGREVTTNPEFGVVVPPVPVP